MPPQPDRGLLEVSGRVIDRATRAPVGDVEVVFADGASEASVVASQDGRYRLALPAGRYRAFVRGDGVMSTAPPVAERVPARPDPDLVGAPRLELVPALALVESIDGVDLEVERVGRLRGRVVDRAGQVVAGAIVRAVSADDGDAARPVLGSDVAETDAAGRFELELAAATYAVEASADHAAGARAAAAATVVAGAATDVDLVLEAGCLIAGRAVRADGRPVTGGTLERGDEADGRDGFFSIGALASDGSFVWSTTEPTTLSLRAWPWASPPSAAQRFECGDGERYADVVLVVPDASPDLSGRVVTADGRPVPFAFVDIRGESPGAESQQERADADGAWAVYALPAGAYRVASVVDGAGVAVAHVAAPAQDVELRMPGEGAVQGEVRGISDGLVTFTVVACSVGDDVLDASMRRAVRVTDGRYRLDAAPACHLSLQVERGDLRLFVEAAVTPGGVTRLDLDFPDDQPVSVRGVVVDAAGRPAGGATVSASGSGDGATTETDAAGRFALVARSGDALVAEGAGGVARAALARHGAPAADLVLTLEPWATPPPSDGD
ncbi:MAG: carboxypeptidase-like regulatory domain-containing protein [Kofleriaceae bacterium]